MKPVTLETLASDQKDRIVRCHSQNDIMDWINDINDELKSHNKAKQKTENPTD